MEKIIVIMIVFILAAAIRIFLNFTRIRQLYRRHQKKLDNTDKSLCEHDWITKMQYDPFTGHGIAWSRCLKCGRQKHTWRI